MTEPTQGNSSKPTPDPTILTTEQLLREIANAKDLVQAEMKGIKDAIDAKLDGRDHRAGAERTINDVRFAGIERDFAAIEAWRKEQKLDTKTAVDAALQAAEKAVREQTVASEKAITKSETSASEQSRQQYATFSASLKGLESAQADVKDRVGKIEPSVIILKSLEDSVSDLKDRMTRVESLKQGAMENRNTQRLDIGSLVGVVAVAIAVISFVLASR